jgi:hypothetical protein
MTSGRRAGCHLSESWMEHICSDNAVGAHKLSLFVRLRTLVVSGIFWLLFFAVEKE